MKPDPAAMSIAQADAYVEAAEALVEAARLWSDKWAGIENDYEERNLLAALAEFERVKEAQK